MSTTASGPASVSSSYTIEELTPRSISFLIARCQYFQRAVSKETSVANVVIALALVFLRAVTISPVVMGDCLTSDSEGLDMNASYVFLYLVSRQLCAHRTSISRNNIQSINSCGVRRSFSDSPVCRWFLFFAASLLGSRQSAHVPENLRYKNPQVLSTSTHPTIVRDILRSETQVQNVLSHLHHRLLRLGCFCHPCCRHSRG